VNVQAGNTISYVVSMDNNLNFDEASLSFTGTQCVSAPLTLRKAWVRAKVNDRADLTASRGGVVVDSLTSIANSANETDVDATTLTVFQGESITLAETLAGTNTGTYVSALSCSGGGTLSGNALTVNATGTPLVCTWTNTGPVTANLSITKTNTPGVNNNVDQANDVVVMNATTSYTVVVTNTGPDAVSGAVVTDAPGAGLNCPTTNPVACSSTASPSACPVGALTIASLQGGVTLGNLPATAGGNAVTLSFSCTVQ
jgi:uncharacterized repeat protein (TIGR01451 family)